MDKEKPRIEQPEPTIEEAGGGGGTFGATMGSRLEDVIHGLGPAEAADTGGVVDEPPDLIPLRSAGELKWASTPQAQADRRMGETIREEMEREEE